MAPSLNDIRIQGYFVFHVVSELPTISTVFDIKADWNQTLLETHHFIIIVVYFVWYTAVLWKLNVYFPEMLFYMLDVNLYC
jgi:hypothetical protein